MQKNKNRPYTVPMSAGHPPWLNPLCGVPCTAKPHTLAGSNFPQGSLRLLPLSSGR